MDKNRKIRSNAWNMMTSYRLISYIQANRNRIETEGLTQPMVAAEFRRENPDCNVTDRTVRTAFSHLGLKLRQTGTSESNENDAILQQIETMKQDMTLLTESYKKLHTRYIELASRLKALETGLGVSVVE